MDLNSISKVLIVKLIALNFFVTNYGSGLSKISFGVPGQDVFPKYVTRFLRA